MADMTKSIKEASDKELDEMIVRLGKEATVQDFIARIRRRSMPSNEYTSYNETGVSTEAPVGSLYHVRDFIEHHGIMGMHWGIRRKRGADGLVVDGPGPSDDYNKARELKRKGLKNLSNAELKAYVDRINLEVQYEKINKKPVGAAQKFVQDILLNSGKQALTTFASKQMSDRLEKIVKK